MLDTKYDSKKVEEDAKVIINTNDEIIIKMLKLQDVLINDN